jgi:hypothetical protein
MYAGDSYSRSNQRLSRWRSEWFVSASIMLSWGKVDEWLSNCINIFGRVVRSIRVGGGR